jgi:hypothetical protein
VQTAGRALVYGFARMNIDGHFPRWGVPADDIERTAEAVLDLFIAGIAKPSDAKPSGAKPSGAKPSGKAARPGRASKV